MDSLTKEKQKFYHLSFWWFFLVSIAVGVLGEGIAFLQGWGVQFNDWGYFLICGISFLLCLSYLAFAHVHFRVKPSWPFLLLFLLLWVGSTVAVCLFPEETNIVRDAHGDEEAFVAVYTLKNMSRARYIACFAVFCLYFYVLWAIAPKCFRSSRCILVYLYGAILFCLFLIVYSLIVEWDAYVSYFNPDIELPSDSGIQSCTGNRNTFAFFLLLGIILLGIQQGRRHCWANYVLMALFVVEEVLIFSKTCVIILALYIPAFAIYRFLKTVRLHPVRSSVCLYIFLNVMILFGVAWAICVNVEENSFFSKLSSMYDSRIFGGEYGSVEARADYWRFIVNSLNDPLRILFGLGEGNMQWFLGAYDGKGTFGTVHSGFMLQLGTGGILRSLAYVLLVSYVLYLYIRGFVKRRRGTLPFLLGLICIHVHGLVENTSILETDGKGIILLILLVLPFLIEKQKEPMEVFSKEEKPRIQLSRHMSYLLAAVVFLSLLGAVSLYLARIYELDLLFWEIGLGVLASVALFLIILACCLEKKSFLRGFLWMSLVLIAFMVGAFAAAYFLPLEQIASSIALISWALVVGYVLLLSLFRKKLDFSSFAKRQIRIEDYISAHSPRWFAKGQKREDRYLAKPRTR